MVLICLYLHTMCAKPQVLFIDFPFVPVLDLDWETVGLPFIGWCYSVPTIKIPSKNEMVESFNLTFFFTKIWSQNLEIFGFLDIFLLKILLSVSKQSNNIFQPIFLISITMRDSSQHAQWVASLFLSFQLGGSDSKVHQECTSLY